ncbi:phosphoglucosamine mutase [Alkalilimnicola ehrlichii]|uniref:Phosphoglucosamine mutase n=1 Tax=Alkalilimnicola ehrlichii TaxID=351052 RepID=A0A3E0X1E0_9GAMM|nr:phosphoglucosamine mutase [Alkalilimnicola ehrlichii]RFA30566.1 phosphoglucosamine mutase [Alkalilimnicola ehrlichii]RFA38116.1 phosphoglucosamine mutase [Alkalilimnicola ehrlichii]
MEKRLFGTDGIRGKVGEYPITADCILKLGWAAGRVFAGQGGHKVLIGKDTRVSGYMFESALEAGLSAAGVDIVLLGPMPTPAIAYLTRTLHACAGIVISASHNPHYDNGIKFFSGQGEKLDDETELAIERELDKPLQTVESAELGRVSRLVDAPGRYIEFCKRAVDLSVELNGLKIVVDCANGAAYQVAPAVFDELGADVVRTGAEPDGVNINVDCGSMHTANLQQRVRETNAHVGIALDGDGDRVLMVDERGEVLDGDEILYIIARSRHERGLLAGPVVGTLMSNLGLEQALAGMGVGFKRAKVGDRYVMEMLRDSGGLIGGESSGHIICLDRTTTGDGVVSALQVLEVMAETGRPLHELKQGMTKLPQHMVNVPIARGSDVHASPMIQEAVADVETTLGDAGRVLLRPSGTEPVVRVMVEGADSEQVVALAEQLADAVTKASSSQAVEVN